MGFGEFSVLSVVYLIASGTAVLWMKARINRMIRVEPKSKNYDPTDKERAVFFAELTGFMYGYLGAGLFVILDFLGWYDGPLWLPFAINVPALVVGLYAFGQLQVTRPQRRAAAQDTTEGWLTVWDQLSFFHLERATDTMLIWAMLSFVLVFALSLTGYTNWASLFVWGVPVSVWFGVLYLSTKVA